MCCNPTTKLAGKQKRMCHIQYAAGQGIRSVNRIASDGHQEEATREQMLLQEDSDSEVIICFVMNFSYQHILQFILNV